MRMLTRQVMKLLSVLITVFLNCWSVISSPLNEFVHAAEHCALPNAHKYVAEAVAHDSSSFTHGKIPLSSFTYKLFRQVSAPFYFDVQGWLAQLLDLIVVTVIHPERARVMGPPAVLSWHGLWLECRVEVTNRHNVAKNPAVEEWASLSELARYGRYVLMSGVLDDYSAYVSLGCV